MTKSDETLVLLAKDGDGVAFRQLLERHYDTVYRVAYRFLGSAADAEDLAQEVCADLAMKIAGFKGLSRFTTWLYSVTLNAVRDRARRQAAQKKLQVNYVAFAAQQAADWADSDTRLRWLYQALDAQDQGLKETALLVLAENLSHAEAGAALGISEGTVSWRMHEVKKRLKAMARDD